MLKNKAKIPSNLRGFFMSFKPKKNRLVQSDGINWKLIKQIDDGGNGLIWAAHQELNLSEICVFKFIPPATESNNINQIKKKREFEVHTELYKNNYNVLPVFDYSFNPESYSWLRLPLAKTFKNGVAETAFLQKIHYLIQLCNDIKALHSNNYCHRDIKPNNLLFLEDKLYLADFGLVTDPQETTGIMICAELAGDFHLGYARQLTDKSSLLFDLAF